MKTATESEQEGEVSLEVLMASIYYLMTRYAKSPDAKVSKGISDHLQMLNSHPDCDSKILQKAGRRLAIQWQEILYDKDSKYSKNESLFPNQSQLIIH